MLYMLVQRGGSGKSSKKVPAPNSASSGSKVLGCVELVCSAFSEGAELTTKLSRRQRTRREHEYHHEIQLQSVLAQGKRQIQAHYKEGFARFGEAFLVGDDATRDRLLCVAIEMHSEINTSLQNALHNDQVQLDLVKLHSKVITSRHDVLRSLDDLCLRLNPAWPLPASRRERATDTMKMVAMSETRGSRASVVADKVHNASQATLTSTRPNTLARLPSTVSVSSTTSKRSGVKRMFSERLATSFGRRSSVLIEPVESPVEAAEIRSHHRRNSSNRSALQRLDSSVHPDLPGSKSSIRSSANSALSRLETRVHPDMPNMSSLTLKHSKSSSKSSSSSSGHSTRDSMISGQGYSPTTPTTPMSEMSADHFSPKPFMMHTESPRQPYEAELDDSCSVTSKDYDAASLYSQVEAAPNTPITPIMEEFPHPIACIEEEEMYVDSPISPLDTYVPPVPSKHPAHRLSASFSSSTFGLPSQSDLYHGFCKGAWTMRERAFTSNSLEIRTIPSGYYDRLPVWGCSECQFHSPTITTLPANLSLRQLIMNKTSAPLPDEIYISSSGIAYRWSFLAKSHIRCRDACAAAEGRYVYGCIFCSAEGKESGCFGDVDTLMTHIDTRHAGRTTGKVLKRAGCIEGRVADRREEWDINICVFDI